MNNIKRGDILIISSRNDIVGCEQCGDRPAIVVSNNQCNRFSDVIEIVYITSSTKNKKLPTHVDIFVDKKSIALCEQINSISKKRIKMKRFALNSDKMKEIDNALKISLGLK